tara:strand:- start:95 stop:355 length:261 start_codon:yes stop_codon:yes gene_type:complete
MRVSTFSTFLILKMWKLLSLFYADNSSFLPYFHLLGAKNIFQKFSSQKVFEKCGNVENGLFPIYTNGFSLHIFDFENVENVEKCGK